MDSFHSEQQLEDLAAYALGALAGAARGALEAHLLGCAACRRALAELQTAAGLLPYGLPLQQPPGHLRDAILARARRSARPPLRRPGGRAERSSKNGRRRGRRKRERRRAWACERRRRRRRLDAGAEAS